MNIWDWVDEQRQEAMHDGNDQKLRLCWMHVQAYQLRETDPGKALELYETGGRLAQTLHEPWWVLFYDEWRVTALLFFLRDYTRGLDLAIRTNLEARKPHYQGFPARLSIQRNLVVAYIGIDPLGYRKEVEEALQFLQEEMSREGEDRFLVLGSQREFALELNNLELAERLSLQSLALADVTWSRTNGVHHSVFNYSGLCEIAWRRGDWKALLEWTEAGEKAARTADLKMELVEFLMWQAVLQQQQGNVEKANACYRRALTRVTRLKMPPDRAFFDGLAAFHEHTHDWGEALQGRRWQLQTLDGTGRFAPEVRCRVRICRLLAQLHEPFAHEEAAARLAAARLRDPSLYLRQLDELH